MSRNVELKARYDNLQAGHQVARQVGALLHAIERQRDTYFHAATGRLKLRERWAMDQTGSLAQPSPSQLIWYHRSNDTAARVSDYTLVVIENGEQMRHLTDTA